MNVCKYTIKTKVSGIWSKFSFDITDGYVRLC